MSSINTNYSANQVQAQNQTIKGNQNGQQGQTVDESYNFNKGGNGGTLGGFTFKNCKETQNDFNLKSTEPAGGGGGTTSPQDWSFLSKLGDYAADIINALPKKNVTDYSTQAGQQALTNVNNAISTWGDSLQSVEGTRTEATHANLQTTGNAALSEAGNLEDAVAASNAEIGDQAADIDAAQTATAENVVATESEFNEALKNTGIVVAETTESVNLADEGAQTAAAAVGETETAVAAQNDANAAAVADAADATQVANEQFTEGQAISKEDAQLLREAINGTAVAEQGAQAAETDKTNAEQNVRDLYSQKTEAEGVVGQKQTALSTAEGKLATAEADVTSAKAALSGVKRDDPSYAGLKAELDRAEAKVKTEEQNVKNVEKELKQAEKERDKLIKQHDDAKDNYDNKVLPAYADAVDNLESAKATEKAAQEKAGISDEQLSALKENLNKAETAKNTAIETQKSYEVEGKQAVRDAEAASDAAADNLTLAQ